MGDKILSHVRDMHPDRDRKSFEIMLFNNFQGDKDWQETQSDRRVPESYPWQRVLSDFKMLIIANMYYSIA